VALKILRYPDPRLKQESLPVEKIDDALRDFIAELELTCAPALAG